MPKFLVPFLLFLLLAVFLSLGLKLNPREIPSPLIDKQAPDFSLPILHNPGRFLDKKTLTGKVWLLNVWASWCVSCRAEHPVLNAFAGSKSVVIIGLNYKDDPEAARNWLRQLGNPYDASLMDLEGRVGIDWGVYGVPETFVIDKGGVVRHKHVGPLKESDVRETLAPLIAQLEEAS
ncbi:MAG: DsbE family thiol:disulfide interchange protein [Gammaproteobacteria bacterium]